MKLKPYLPENTFRLSEDSLPQEHQTQIVSVRLWSLEKMLVGLLFH